MVNMRHSEEGQTLLIVIFAMSLGLLVIVSTAARALGSVARTTQTNYYQKATAAAEGGAEIYLAKPFTELNVLSASCPASQLSYIDNTAPPYVPSSCIVTMNGSAGESRAFMGVESYPVGTESLYLKSQPGETIHVNLQNIFADSNMIRVCWKGLGIKPYSLSYYFLYKGTVGNYEVDKKLYSCDPDEPLGSSCTLPGADDLDRTNIVEPEFTSAGYWCYQMWLSADPVALRIFTFPDGGEYMITALNSSGSDKAFPPQGYRIVSIGEVTGAGGATSLESKKATRKKVTVEKTFPYPAGPWWDFAVTSINGTMLP